MPDGQTDPRQQWLLLIYRVPQEPPGRRTFVWRQLKQLGAVYLQQAAAILPDRPDLRAALDGLAHRIEEFPGEASLLPTASPTQEWEQRLIARFNEARDAEYAEVVENIERFEDEIRREQRKGRFGFAQLEDLEADWQKIEQWHSRIDERDFFGAPGRAAVDEALTRGRAALDEFTATVYARERAVADQADARGVQSKPLPRPDHHE